MSKKVERCQSHISLSSPETPLSYRRIPKDILIGQRLTAEMTGAVTENKLMPEWRCTADWES